MREKVKEFLGGMALSEFYGPMGMPIGMPIGNPKSRTLKCSRVLSSTLEDSLKFMRLGIGLTKHQRARHSGT